MGRGCRPGCGYVVYHHPGWTPEMTPRMAAGGVVDLKLGHYSKGGVEVIDVEGEIDISTAQRLRELLIELAGQGNCQLIVNLDKVGFLDSTGLGVLVGGLKRVRPHDGSLGSGLHPGADPEDLQDHRADEGLRHLSDRGPGHRGQKQAISPGKIRCSRRPPVMILAGAAGHAGVGETTVNPTRPNSAPQHGACDLRR